MKKIFDRRIIRLIAVVTMIIDHIGYHYPVELYYFRYIGRISFPLFLFLLIEGYCKTKSYGKYLLRLFILAILSEIPFDLYLNNSYFYIYNQNVIWTFILLLLLFKVFDFIKSKIDYFFYKVPLYVLAISLFATLSDLLFTDYSGFGIILGSILYLLKDNYKFKYPLYAFFSLIFSNIFMLIPLIFMHFYDDKKIKTSKIEKSINYLFYPVHFLILYLIFH